MASTTERPVVAGLRQQMEALGEAVAGIEEAPASRRTATGEWSVKEQLSHLHGADGNTFLDTVRQFFDEDQPVIDVEPGITHFNASRQAMTVGQLLARVQSQYRAIADVAAAASADDLARRGQITLLAQTPFGDRPTLAEWLQVMSAMHVAGHLAQLQGAAP